MTHYRHISTLLIYFFNENDTLSFDSVENVMLMMQQDYPHQSKRNRTITTEMGDLVELNGVEDDLRRHVPNTHIDTAERCHRPCEAPPIAPEHVHRPQEHRRLPHVVSEDQP